MFDIESFIDECDKAARSPRGRENVREALRRAMSQPAEIIAALGEPKRAGVKSLHRSRNLTILNIVWPPSFTSAPHNHLLWAEVGVYYGREDNIFWRNSGNGAKSPIKAVGAACLCAGDCHSMEIDEIHSVTNPLDIVNAGLHIYGGDLAQGAPRSMWDGQTLHETTLDYKRDDDADAKYNASLAG